MFAVRMNLGDPKFENVSDIVSDMLSPSFGKQIQQKILDNTTFPSEYYMSRFGSFHFGGVNLSFSIWSTILPILKVPTFIILTF